MTAPEAEAALVERARIERLALGRIAEHEATVLATHSCKADDARAAIAELRWLLAAIEGGVHHDLGRGR